MFRSGQRLKLAFRLSLADGTLIEAASREAPLVWRWGDGALAPCLEAALSAAAVDAPQPRILTPEQAFGWPEPDQVFELPRSDFSNLEPLAVGLVLSFETPGGAAAAGRVQALTATQVQVDFSHPLAGHCLIFEFEFVEIEHAAEADRPG